MNLIKYKNVSYNSYRQLTIAYNVIYSTFMNRLKRGMSIHKAIKTSTKLGPCTKITIEGKKYECIKDACKYYNIPYTRVVNRLAKGWSVNQAFDLTKRTKTCKGSVYIIFNSINDKVYIGITVQGTRNRYKSHLSAIRNGVRNKLYDNMRLLGVENFDVRTVCKTNCRYELQQLEIEYIIDFDSINNGYNEKLGGGAFGNTTGTKITYKGKTYKSIAQLADYLGLDRRLLQSRMSRNIPLDKKYIKKEWIYNGIKYSCVEELMNKFSLKRETVLGRLRRGKPLEDPLRYRRPKSNKRKHIK